MIDHQAAGHQLFPDISADGGVLHALWWDSRNDSCYSASAADRKLRRQEHRAVARRVRGDVDRLRAIRGPATSRLTDVTSNPNYEQFDNRAVPFAGDYLWVTSLGDFAYGVWTD